MKIVLELEILNFEDRLSEMVKDRELSLDQLVAGTPLSRETARKVLTGRDRTQLYALLAVCNEIGFDSQTLKSMLLENLSHLDFQGLVDKRKKMPNKYRKSVQAKKTIDITSG